ncbi:DNA excision repair protein ERCC-1 [Pancytospora philotis]|nr:DNA excision repair protein ERCC-1 [Pancytospora philotis]
MIQVSEVQRGNGVLSYLNAACWYYDADTSADYVINHSSSVLFLSLKFHACRPEYIYKRINRLKKTALNVLMVLVDVPNCMLALRELYRTVPLTIVACRSNEECSLYLRGLDMAKRRTSMAIRKKTPGYAGFVESFPSINKTDSAAIRAAYPGIADLLRADLGSLSSIKGIGSTKASGIIEYLKMPFKK